MGTDRYDTAHDLMTIRLIQIAFSENIGNDLESFAKYVVQLSDRAGIPMLT